jgi:hypothetical protein
MICPTFGHSTKCTVNILMTCSRHERRSNKLRPRCVPPTRTTTTLIWNRYRSSRSEVVPLTEQGPGTRLIDSPINKSPSGLKTSSLRPRQPSPIPTAAAHGCRNQPAAKRPAPRGCNSHTASRGRFDPEPVSGTEFEYQLGASGVRPKIENKTVGENVIVRHLPSRVVDYVIQHAAVNVGTRRQTNLNVKRPGDGPDSFETDAISAISVSEMTALISDSSIRTADEYAKRLDQVMMMSRLASKRMRCADRICQPPSTQFRRMVAREEPFLRSGGCRSMNRGVHPGVPGVRTRSRFAICAGKRS